MKLTSPAFTEGSPIPQAATTDGSNTNPALAWSEVPMDARSLVLIVEDTGADTEPWVHWVVFDIPPTTTQILEGKPPLDSIEGTTSAGTHSYAGVEPDSFSGTHTCTFTLYALDNTLRLPPQSDQAAVRAAAEGHIMAEASLSGTCTGTK